MPDLKKPNIRCSLSFSKLCSSLSAKSIWSSEYLTNSFCDAGALTNYEARQMGLSNRR